MSEKEFKVDVYEVEYVCDECHKGFMIPTGITLTSNPPQYPHKCAECSNTEIFRIQYPKVMHKPYSFPFI